MSDVRTHPLVTFALFAYNQEQYIREAVEGALSQTYEPLEIILSDDSSSDRTFAILKEMASDYHGPHRVIVRRESVNRGLVGHLLEVASRATGQYLVVAAGDDVSLPERTSVLVDLMVHTGARVAKSNVNKMAETGDILLDNFKHENKDNYLWKIIKASDDYFINGATAVYEIGFILEAFAPIREVISSQKIYYEDALLSAYAVATDSKPVEYTKQGLVNYRINPNSISNFSKVGDSLDSELSRTRNEYFRAVSRFNLLTAIEKLADEHTHLGELANRPKIEKDKRLSVIVIGASDRTFWRRVDSLLTVKTLDELGLSIARLFGERVHAKLRLLVRRNRA